MKTQGAVESSRSGVRRGFSERSAMSGLKECCEIVVQCALDLKAASVSYAAIIAATAPDPGSHASTDEAMTAAIEASAPQLSDLAPEEKAAFNMFLASLQTAISR